MAYAQLKEEKEKIVEEKNRIMNESKDIDEKIYSSNVKIIMHNKHIGIEMWNSKMRSEYIVLL